MLHVHTYTHAHSRLLPLSNPNAPPLVPLSTALNPALNPKIHPTAFTLGAHARAQVSLPTGTQSAAGTIPVGALSASSSKVCDCLCVHVCVHTCIEFVCMRAVSKFLPRADMLKSQGPRILTALLCIKMMILILSLSLFLSLTHSLSLSLARARSLSLSRTRYRVTTRVK